MKIIAISSLTDNYCWMLSEKNLITLVDPGEAKPVIQALNDRNAKPQTILITHHHPDHWQGVPELLERYPGVQVISCGGHYPFETIPMHEACQWTDPKTHMTWNIITLPGHTLKHIGYIHQHHFFCGDALFSGGCGRCFEGTFDQMADTLKKISSLPKQTKIYAGHEYTLNNLNFAQSIEPNNQKISKAIQTTQALFAQGKPSLPTTLSHELKINPFLRLTIPSVRATVAKMAGIQTPMSEVDTLENLRKLKDLA